MELKKIKRIKSIILCIQAMILSVTLTGCLYSNTNQKEIINKTTEESNQKAEKIKGTGRSPVKRDMTMQDVIAVKNKNNYRKFLDMLSYNETLPCLEDIVFQNYDCYLMYTFDYDIVDKEFYIMSTKKIKEVDFIEDYNRIKEILSKHYGEPDREQKLYTSVQKKEGLDLREEILTGGLVLITDWIIDENMEVSLSIYYSKKREYSEIGSSSKRQVTISLVYDYYP